MSDTSLEFDTPEKFLEEIEKIKNFFVEKRNALKFSDEKTPMFGDILYRVNGICFIEAKKLLGITPDEDFVIAKYSFKHDYDDSDYYWTTKENAVNAFFSSIFKRAVKRIEHIGDYCTDPPRYTEDEKLNRAAYFLEKAREIQENVERIVQFVNSQLSKGAAQR